MDDLAVATAAAERILQSEIKQFVPGWAQSKIPADLIHKAASEIANAVIHDLANAHAGQSPPASS